MGGNIRAESEFLNLTDLCLGFPTTAPGLYLYVTMTIRTASLATTACQSTMD